MSYSNGYAEPWPEDVPPPAVDPDEDELENLAALWRERQREAGIEPPAAPVPWVPATPIAEDIWRALPSDGHGVDYWRVVRSVAADRWDLAHVQVALLGLVLLGRVYTMPLGGGREGGRTSMVGRGTDPRLGAVAYCGNALEGFGR